MRNIAKCNLCKDIIESFHPTDFVACKCGEITVYGGQEMRCTAEHWDNFLRIDDNGKEIHVKIKSMEELPNQQPNEITKKDLLQALDEQIKSIEELPDHAKLGNVNHYDLLSLMIVVSSFFKARD
jgi:hypothetical protein